MEKAAALAELATHIAACQQCPLYQTAHRAVPGDGNPNAEIVFVGEGPGAKEDETGLPFVGAAGKFLNELLESIHLKREDVFIGNVVKHRPPGNRDPLPHELHACTPWLDKQIDIIQPRLIVTLGRFSMAHFLGEGFTISKIHGQPKRRNNQVVMPMYHPAAALYQGSLREVMKKDFKKIPKLLTVLKKES